MKTVPAGLLRKVWALIRRTEHELEYDPETQWRFHRRMCWFWLANFPVITFMFFLLPHIWVAVALFVNTIYSLYANFCTEFDGVHSSYAGWQSQRSREILEKEDNA